MEDRPRRGVWRRCYVTKPVSTLPFLMLSRQKKRLGASILHYWHYSGAALCAPALVLISTRSFAISPPAKIAQRQGDLVMKLRHPSLIRALGLLGGWVIRWWTDTLATRIRS